MPSSLSVIARSALERYLRTMSTHAEGKLVTIVDDDESMRNALMGLLKAAGLPTRVFASAEDFLGSGILHVPAGFPIRGKVTVRFEAAPYLFVPSLVFSNNKM